MSDKNFTAIKLVKKPLTISLTTSVLAGFSALPSVGLANNQLDVPNDTGFTEQSFKVSDETTVVSDEVKGEIIQQDNSVQPLAIEADLSQANEQSNLENSLESNPESNLESNLESFTPEQDVNDGSQPVIRARMATSNQQQAVNNTQPTTDDSNVQTFVPEQSVDTAGSTNDNISATIQSDSFITIGQRDVEDNYSFYDDVHSNKYAIYSKDLSSEDWNDVDETSSTGNTARLASAARRYRPSGIWKEVSDGYKFSKRHNKLARRFIQREKKLLLTEKRGHLDGSLKRASKYLHYTLSEAKKRNLPTELALLPLVESGFNPRSYSKSGAVGLWQITPITARELNIERNPSYDGRYDLIDSTQGAYKYLKRLYKRYHSWETALAAYNAGPVAVDRAIEKNKRLGKPTDFWSLPLSMETKIYVPRLIAFAEIIQNPGRYKVRLPATSGNLSFATVRVGNGVTLDKVVAITGVQKNKIRDLNLGLRRGRIDIFVSDKKILVPRSVSRAKINKIRALSNSKKTKAHGNRKGRKGRRDDRQMINTRHSNQSIYIVKPGDTLSGVAKKHRMTLSQLARYNHVSTRHRLDIGERLKLTDGKGRKQPKTKKVNNRGRTQHQRHTSPVRYQVQAGDTLSGIARKLGTTPQAIASLNTFNAEYLLKKDEYITIPRKRSDKLVAQSKSRSKSQDRVESSQEYTVISGDSLSRVAQKFKVSIKDLAKANKLSVKDYLRVDQVITIPRKSSQSKNGDTQARSSKKSHTSGGYQVQSGDSLSKIAKKYGTTVADIMRINGIKNADELNAGEVIKLPSKSNKLLAQAKRSNKKSAKKTSKKSSVKPLYDLYEVKSGDALSKLAKKFDIDLKELARANDLSTTSNIKVGQKLKLPY